jgi:short-subunit dehydrogenase
MTRPHDADLRGLNALVTGASRGLGLLLARELSRRGCRVMVCARDHEELVRAEKWLRTGGGEIRSLACDLTAPDAPAHLVAEAEEAFGGIDILVNNAGIIQVGPFGEADENDFRAAAEIMYFAPLRMIMAALPGMRARGPGRIVNIASVGGRIAPPHLLPYAAAKFAVTGLSEGLRAELAADRISVTTVLPGLMRTGSHTAARFSGNPQHEYAWFATAASLPLLSMDAERAAREVVDALRRRRPEIVLTAAARIAVRLHGIAPATTTRALTLAARLLPGPGAAPQHDVSGSTAAERLGSAVVGRLTALGDQAGRRFNQRAA